MTLTNDKIAETNNAYLRDGALILSFDMAETPFVSRFDLDSLAQANFEISDKKDGVYSLVLRDYTGQTQTIGQFNSKTDAHHALHAILKALLSQPEKVVVKTCSTSIWPFVKWVLKALLALLVAFFILYVYVLVRTPVKNNAVIMPPVSQNESAVPLPMESPGVEPAGLPTGEAMDADDFLKVTPQATPTLPAPKE